MNLHNRIALTILTFTLFSSYTFAQEVLVRAEDCTVLFKTTITKHPYTVSDFAQIAKAKMAEVNKQQPPPNFVKPIAIKRPGTQPPKALQAFYPKDILPRAVPGINAEHPVVAHRKDTEFKDGTLGSVRVTIENPSKNPALRAKYPTLDTEVIIQVPGNQFIPNSQYLIPPTFEDVYVELHGVGTTSADVITITKFAEFLTKRNKPTLGFALLGHGDASDIVFDTYEEYFEFVMRVIEKVVPPSVAVGLGGHSGGAIIAAMMHKLSYRKRFQQIKYYFPINPAIDAAPGKSREEKIAIETRIREEIDRVIHGLQEDKNNLLPKISKGDLSFKGGATANIRFNLTGEAAFSPLMQAFNLDLVPAGIKRFLKPACVVASSGDALCTVGRAKGLDYFRRTYGAKNTYLLTRAETFEGIVDPLGHQSMDAIKVLPDGTKVNLVYQIVVDMAKELGFRNPAPLDPARRTLAEISRDLLIAVNLKWQNNFAWREYLANARSYMMVESPKYVESVAFLERLGKKVADFKEEVRLRAESVYPLKRSEFVKKFHQDPGINPRIPVAPEFESDKVNELHLSAKKILGLHRSPEREAELKAYLARIASAIKATHSPERETAKAESDKIAYQNFVENFKKNPQKNFDFSMNLVSYVNRKKDPKKVTDIFAPAKDEQTRKLLKYIAKYSFLELVDRFYWAAAIVKEGEDTQAEFAATTPLKTVATGKLIYENVFKAMRKINKSHFDQNLDTYLSIVETFVQARLDIRNKRINADLIEERQVIASIKGPNGIRNKADAEWELRAYNFSNEEYAKRRQIIARMVREYESALKQFKDRYDAQTKKMTDEYPWPNDLNGKPIKTLKHAEEIVIQLAKVKDQIPPDSAGSDLQQISEQIVSLTEQWNRSNLEVINVKGIYTKTKYAANKLAKQLNDAVDLDFNSVVKPKIEFTNLETVAFEKEFWRQHHVIMEAELAYQSIISKAREARDKYSEGSPELGKVLDELDDIQNNFIKLRANFTAIKAKVTRSRVAALLRGEFKLLEPGKLSVEKIASSLRELIGSPENVLAGTADKSSLEYKVLEAIEQYNKVLSENLELSRRIDALKLKRSELTKSKYANNHLITIEEIDWGNMFEKLTYEQMVEWLTQDPLRRQALEKVVSEWNNHWTDFVASDRLRFSWYRLEKDNDGKHVVQILKRD